MIRGCNALRPGVKVMVTYCAERVLVTLIKYRGLDRWYVRLANQTIVTVGVRGMRVVKWEETS